MSNNLTDTLGESLPSRLAPENLHDFFIPDNPEEYEDGIFPDEYMAADQLQEFKQLVETIQALASDGQLEVCYFGIAEPNEDGFDTKLKRAMPGRPVRYIADYANSDFEALFGITDFTARNEMQSYWIIAYKDEKQTQPVLKAIKFQLSERLEAELNKMIQEMPDLPQGTPVGDAGVTCFDFRRD